MLLPSVCTAALYVYAAVSSWEPFSLLTLLNGFYGIIANIVIITLITIFVIIGNYKKEDLTEKVLIILIFLCFLNNQNNR